jgi:adenosine kinase
LKISELIFIYFYCQSQSLEEIASWIVRLPRADNSKSRIVVLTQGCDATIVATSTTVQSFPVPMVPPSQIVDLNGAGDAFCGGFLSQLVQSRSLSQCVHAGHYAAGVVICHPGCSLPEELADVTALPAQM